MFYCRRDRISARKLYRTHDFQERAVVRSELVARRNTDDVEQRAVAEKRRVDRDPLLAARRLRHVRELDGEPLLSRDRRARGVRAAPQLRIALTQRVDQFGRRGIQIVRFVARDADLDAVRKDARTVDRSLRALGRERDDVVARKLLPVVRHLNAEDAAFLERPVL